MKFTIDTNLKTILINEMVELGEFMEKIKIMLPNDEWKIYTISAFYNVINPYTPILTYPYYPTFEPYTICKTQH